MGDRLYFALRRNHFIRFVQPNRLWRRVDCKIINLITREVVVSLFLAHFSSWLALLATVNSYTETVFVAQGATIASVSSNEAVSALSLRIVLTDNHIGKSPASDSAFPATVNTDLTPIKKGASMFWRFKGQGLSMFGQGISKTSAAHVASPETDRVLFAYGHSVFGRQATKDTKHTNTTYNEIQRNVDDRLKRNILHSSSSPLPPPVVLVPKRTVPYDFASNKWRRLK